MLSVARQFTWLQRALLSRAEYVFVCLHTYVFSLIQWLQGRAGPYQATYRRCVSIALTDIVVFFFSYFAWKRIDKFLDCVLIPDTKPTNRSTKSESDNNLQFKNGKRKVFKYAYGAFVVLATFSWYMPYVPLFRISDDAHWVPLMMYLSLGFLLQFLVCIYFIISLKWIMKMCQKWLSPTQRMHVHGKPDNHATDVPIAALYALICCMYGVHVTSLPQQIVSVEVPIAGLPKSLDGFRIAMLTDLHLGPTVGRTKLQQVVNIVNTMKADSAVIVGDLVDGPVERLGAVTEIIKNIKVKGNKYFVTGNHEYYSPGVDQWFMFLKTYGFTVLHNEHVKIMDPSNKEFFYLAGTDDIQATQLGYTGHGYDLDKAVSSCNKEYPIVLLAHQPNAAQKALDSEYNIKLVLSGHTHGGQMFPFTILTAPFNAFQKGLYKYKERYVYVSQGTLYWGFPLRIGTFMEITEIILRAE